MNKPTDRHGRLKAEAAMLPQVPGVYQFVNAAGEVIYVGKAKNLRKRVSHYFLANGGHGPKVKIMIRYIDSIRHIVVSSEGDALLLENNLIKSFKPRYNTMLKDDKTYPWIVVRNEPFPRIESTRRLVRDGSRYFGPYASVTMQKNVLELIHSIYQIRTCSLNLEPEQIARAKYTICLQYHLGNCQGPCEGLQLRPEYDEGVDMAIQILKGDLRGTRRYLEENMQAAAAVMKFEQAALFKSRLERLEEYSSKSVVVSSTIGNLDIFALLIDDGSAYCNFVRIVAGAVVNSFTAEFSLGADQDSSSILTRAIEQMSEKIEGGLARHVLVPFLPETGLFPGSEFSVPKRGDKLKLLEFSERGAKMYRLEKLKNIEIKDPARHVDRVMTGLQKALHMDVQPRHIECFDNSNLQGTHPVAACVVFRDGKPSRKEYRHFNVKTVIGADDFATMREIIRRRYTRLLSEEAQLPDLVIVDGGKGQLSSAYAVFQELGLVGRVTLIGLAKRIEEVFFPQDPMPYYLEKGGEPLKVVMHIRDEAHRFGITFHRKKRSLAFIRSELEGIPGLGSVSVTKLLRKFRTVAAIKKASEEDLAAVVGASRARAVREFYRQEPVESS